MSDEDRWSPPRRSPSGPPPDSPEPREFTGLHAVIWMSLAFFLMVLGTMVAVALRPITMQDLVSLGTISAATFLLVAALLLGRYPAGNRLADGLGARPTHLALTPLGLVLGILAQVPATFVERGIEVIWPMSDEERLRRLALFQHENELHAAILVLVVACLVPLAEEVLFRGAIYGALRRSNRSPARAAVITSIGFALCHFDPRLLLPIALVAAILGFVRATSGSLLPGLAVHVGFNATTMLGLISGAIPESGLELPAAVQVTAWVMTGLCLFLFGWLARTSPVAERSRELEESIVHD